MHTRNTLVMAVLFVLLGSFVYFYEIRGRADREEAEREAGLLLHFDAEQVTDITVTTADGAVTAHKADGRWTITAPVAVPADGESIDALVDNLQNASHERVIVENAEDLSTYGLAEPEASVTLTLADGSTTTLAVGNNTPVGFNLYASAGEGTVYSASRALRDQAKKTLYDLRDRSLLEFEESEVERAEIRTADFNASLRVERSDEGGDDAWFLSSPTEARADAETVGDLLSSLHGGEAEAFVLDSQPTAEQMTEYGLDAPRLAITLWTSGDASQRLLIGADSVEPLGMYAMREGGSSVFVVESDLIEDTPTSLDALRNKQVLALARENIQGIELTSATGTTRVQREGADWRITSAGDLAADASAVSRLLTTLQDLRAESFAAPGTDPGATVVTVKVSVREGDDAASEETVTLDVGGATSVTPADGDADAEPVDARFVSTSADSTVYVVAQEELGDLEVTAFDLRDKTLVRFTQADLTAIELTAGSVTYRLEQNGETWRMVSPSARDLAEGTVSDMLWDLNYLRMEAEATAADDTTTGLADPRFHVVASTAEGVVADVSVGSPAPTVEPDATGRTYARVAGHEGVFEVSSAVAEALQALLDTLEAQ